MAQNNPTPSLVEAYTAPNSPERSFDLELFDFLNAANLRGSEADPPYSMRIIELVHPAATGITDALLAQVPEGSAAVVYFDSVGVSDTFTAEGQYFSTDPGWTDVGPWVAIMEPTEVGWQVWWDELTEPPPPGSRQNGSPIPDEDRTRQDVYLFRSEGATVYLTDVLADQGAAFAAEIDAVFFEHDVTDRAAWEVITKEIMAEHGKIDVLINNAGIFRIAGLADTDDALWDTTIAINQTGVFLGMHTVIPHMVEHGSGSVINISSIAGLRGAGTAFAYAASKWAVRGMTRSAAQTYAANGVRVNSIHPGIIDTPMAHEFVDAGVLDRVQDNIPMGHMAEASDVANMALFLASDESSYCTGSEFIVDGGFTA
ncbi:Cyclopentanol dehydrogenase [Nymphon striatum]|nr:Cyclopentanol dehydrogenase [Nymphon striatum]